LCWSMVGLDQLRDEIHAIRPVQSDELGYEVIEPRSMHIVVRMLALMLEIEHLHTSEKYSRRFSPL
jgi:hypothetical protein